MRPIGIFDSGYGGLTVFKSILKTLPKYDFIYLGDNRRAPYGNRSFETVYQYTLEAIKWFFQEGCPLVILACNTASAKALRTIQQNDLQYLGPGKRVLGVIRPTAEVIGSYTTSGSVGILGTKGTIQSNSYVLEIERFFPEVKVYQQACPLWVPLIENNEHTSLGGHYFIEKNIEELLSQSSSIDTLLLACTHYPLVLEQIRKFLPEKINIVCQGDIVANSLSCYLKRHPEMESALTKQGRVSFFTTDDPHEFNKQGAHFFDAPINSMHLDLKSEKIQNSGL